MYYTKLGKNTVNAVRLAEVLQVLVRHGFADLLRRMGFHDGLPAKVLQGLNLKKAPKGEPATLGQRLRDALTELGPTYIKLGQVLSTRPDLLGAEISNELSHLQDRVAPKDFDQIRPLVEGELGAPLQEVFSEFDETPVASASLSQVYRAKLKTGETVAVKVRRPGILGTVESDLSLMASLAEWMSGRFEEMDWVDPPGIVAEFDRSIHREMDFEIEAAVIDRFRRKLVDMPDVVIPLVYKDYSTGGVLTMEWIDGVRVDEFDAYPERRCERNAIAVLSCQVLCKLVFEHRMFHADPHPGNIFILRDNRMALLDLGMAGNLGPSDVGAIADLFLSIFHQDARECVNALVNLTDESMPENRAALEHELAEFITFEAQRIIGGGRVAKGVERAIQIMRHYKLELAPRFSLLLKALATIENVGRTLVPDLDFVTILQPYLEDFVRERFEPAHIMKEMQGNSLALFRFTRQVPDDISQILQQFRRGRFRLLVTHEYLEKLASTIDRASNRLAVSVITAALIVGSSLIIAVGSPYGSLGVGGFVFAGVLGTALVISILWTRKF